MTAKLKNEVATQMHRGKRSSVRPDHAPISRFYIYINTHIYTYIHKYIYIYIVIYGDLLLVKGSYRPRR